MDNEAGGDGGAIWRDDEVAARRCRSLLSAVDGSVFEVGGDLTFTDVDDAFAAETGYDRPELVGAHASKVFDEASTTALERELEAGVDPVAIDVTVVTVDGDRLAAELRASPLGVDGRDGGAVGFVRTSGSESETTAEPERLPSALPEAERRYRTLAEHFPNGAVAMFDTDLEITLAAGQGFEKVSFDPEEIEGRRVREVFDEGTAAAIEPVFRAALEGEQQSVEVSFEGVEWLLRAVPIGGADPDADSGMAMVVDVTERREAQRELSRRERQLSRLTSNIPGMVYRCDRERGWPMQFASDGARELTGYDAEAFEYGEATFGEDVVVEADRDRLWNEVQAAVDDDEPFSVTYRIETADGERRWVADYGRGVRDGDGDVVAVEGVIIDVTERERMAERMEESERRYRTLVEHFPNGAVALFDEDLRYTAAGGRAFTDLDDSEEDVVGRSIWERYPEDLAEQLEPRFEAALRGEASDFEIEFHDRVWQAHTHPIEEGGEVSGGVIMVQDITDRKERERELERSEQRYRTLVEHFPNGAVAMVDEDLRYRMVGGTPPEGIDTATDELIGERVRDALPAAIGEDLAASYEMAFGGEPNSFEYEFGDFVYRFHTVPVRDDDGEVFAAMGISQDITEQKAQERRLRDAKAQLEAATEAASIGTWEWSIPDDEFVAGASLAKTFGVDPDAARDGVPSERIFSSIHEADRDRIEAEIWEAIDDCGEYEAEYRVRDADDDLRWVFARGHVECDDDGDPLTFPGALADITERKRAEQKLQQQRNQLETLFGVLPVGVVVADADGRILQANETAAEIWGGDVFDVDSVAEYEKYPVREADTGEAVPPEEMTLARVVDGEEVVEPDVYEIGAFDGEQRVVRLEGRPIRDEDGEVSRGVVTLTDITERRRYQKELEESNERLEQFAYAASHDLQEPLRMVTSYLQLLERRYADDLGEDGLEFLEFAVDGANRMREMIDALLEYSRVETRGDPFEPVDLEAVLEDVTRDVQMRIEETDAEITSGSLPTVRGDPSQLRQVVQNLLSNALEYSGDGPPRVHVDAERAGDEWVVSVADEGIGIDPDQHDRVFEVFQRLHSHEEHEGTGIGLALTRRIVERHGGDVWVESAPDEGSTFYFTVPVEEERDG